MLFPHPPPIAIRHAEQSDTAEIFALIESMTSDGTLLRRSEREIAQQLSSFVVACDDRGEFLARAVTAAMRSRWRLASFHRRCRL